MVNRLLVWAAGSRELQRQVTENPIARRAAHRFVAGERLEEALAAAAELNSRGVGGILDLLGEGVRDLAGATRAVEEYEEAIAAIAARGLDATISIKLSQLGQTRGPRRLRGEPQPRSWTRHSRRGSRSRSTWRRAA